ncbi:uncharacterized protein LOC116344364 isoform X2 [Contarinia nasturtii]|uniref:uncharacterized protein LOC116344364 isoform X2 n=1 Tax=Contarinia nasturtii TaxID=265458 RepID=UPI0012D4ACBE|nr:uncharacterized protein LOC116344364 isoform X2 [Contarinia nasturtii]
MEAFSENNPQQIAEAETETMSTTLTDEQDHETDLIALSGYGLEIVWQYPMNITHCVVPNCKIVYETRSQAINHYRERHAPFSILCPECNRPISKQKSNFIGHYEKMHPNVKVPYFVDRTKQNIRKVSKSDPTNAIDVDDLIELKGFGVITKWHYPDINNCAVNGCGLAFGHRSLAIDHYRKCHADNFILCSICKPNKPISTHNALPHYKRSHPDAEIPWIQSEKVINVPSERTKVNELNLVENNQKRIYIDEDDIIPLVARGIETYWSFPKSTGNICPIGVCKLKCASREDAINHFKDQHANHSVLCSICDKPISVRSNADYKLHYQRLHPNKRVPHRIGNLKRQANVGRKRQEIQHKFCPWKECSFKAASIGEVSDHWERVHRVQGTDSCSMEQHSSHSSQTIDDETPESSVEQSKSLPDDGLLMSIQTRTEPEGSNNQANLYFNCLKCSHSFESIVNLREHIMEMHSTQSIELTKRKRDTSTNTNKSLDSANVTKKRKLVCDSPIEISDHSIIVNKNDDGEGSTGCEMVFREIESTNKNGDVQMDSEPFENEMEVEYATPVIENLPNNSIICLSDGDNEDETTNLSDFERGVVSNSTFVPVDNSHLKTHVKTMQVLMMYQPKVATVEIPRDNGTESSEDQTNNKQLNLRTMKYLGMNRRRTQCNGFTQIFNALT